MSPGPLNLKVPSGPLRRDPSPVAAEQGLPELADAVQPATDNLPGVPQDDVGLGRFCEVDERQRRVQQSTKRARDIELDRENVMTPALTRGREAEGQSDD
jgi:hypothetical protein